ncbi:iron ABC transporter permease [Ornithinibacillus sp. 4-3]|uniref:Iron ABC transporter permease n=1 Tax=Ornithinibacillus sp. 4-3 TaxID=3231488 RepID=A0AB39HM73_9BACI
MQHSKKIGAGFLVLALFLILSAIHVSQGQASDGFISFWTNVWNNPTEQAFALGSRLPRLVMGLLAGASLAVCGLLLQTMTKNPLASASTLGIHAGAFFFVVLGTVFFPAIKGSNPLFLTLAGGLLAAFLVSYLVGKSFDPVRVALTGLIVTLLFSSLTSALQLLFQEEVSGLFLWGSGTLLQLDWSGVQFSLPILITTILILILFGHRFDLLLLGEEVATGLGQNVQYVKWLGWGGAIVLASTTVTVVGPIGFVGLLAPHLVRLLGFQTHRSMIIANIFVGSSLLIAADIIIRYLSPQTELPVGAMTAIIGAPALVYLALKMARNSKAGQVVGGKNRIQNKKLFFPVVIIAIIAMFLVSIGYGGTSFTPISEWIGNMFIIEFRLPRVLTCILIGMMMAVSGLLLQTVLRNPLADASVLGITSGANVVAVFFLLVFPWSPAIFVPIGALIGGLGTMFLLLLLSRKKGYDPLILLLVGIAISAISASIIQILLVRANVHATAALTWLAGSTYGTNWTGMYIALGTVLIVFPLIIRYFNIFEMMYFQEEIVTGLGVSVQKTRLMMIIIAVILSSISVSIVGAIGFIGLLAPHIARQLVGPSFRFSIPLTLIIGSSLLLIADFLGRFLLAPMEIPAGIIVSLIGAPYLLYLLKKSNEVSVK